MELTKDITLGVYIPRETTVHLSDPRTKILLSILLITLLFLVKTYIAYGVFTAFALFLIWASQIPVGYAMKGLKPMIPVLIIMWVLQIFLQKPDHAQVIFTMGFLEATDVGLHMGTLMSIRVLLLFLLTTILTMATSMVELTDGIEALLKPFRKIGIPSHELAMTLVIALRFVPTLAEEMEKIVKAQMARGVDFDRGNFIQKTAKMFPIFLPLFLNAFKRAEDLIIAMEARNYTGGAGRTKMRQLKMGPADTKSFLVVLIFSVAIIAVIRMFPPLI
ncbi:MAG: energy-coupling factor transporter transmembrane protein EcfT [Dethiobacter sp.]|jgi:energy-coupling factor transport system permease protein|nr:energy-coupling factor transporter transmembrane protein EcfT [Dethiobacter sp.]